MTAPAPIHYLYAVDSCRGSLDCWTAYADRPVTAEEHWQGHLVRFRITKKTAKRIYYVRREFRGNPRDIGFVDRQKIERDGEIHSPTLRRFLHLAEPPMPEHWAPKRPDVKALKAAMAAAHPDRGGSAEGFREARRRYVEAVGGGR